MLLASTHYDQMEKHENKWNQVIYLSFDISENVNLEQKNKI